MATSTELRAEAPAASGDSAPEPAKKIRRAFSDAEKRALVAEYEAQPSGTGHIVLARHNLASSVMANWRKQFGGKGRSSGVVTASPEAEPIPDSGIRKTSYEEPVTAAVTLDLQPDELDVIDAVAFLDETTREHVLTTIVTRFLAEQPTEVVKLARLRQQRRS